MKLKNILRNAAIMATGAAMLTGCASDYLDTPHNGSISAKDICATTENARAAMLGVCSSMAIYWNEGGGSPALGVIMGFSQGETGLDYYIGELPGQDCYINYIYEAAPSWTIYLNQEQGYLNTGNYVWSTPVWLYSYALLAQVNEILEGIDNAEGSDQERAFTKAQALTMRAHCYWWLLRTYGPRWQDSKEGTELTVPLRVSPAQPQDLAAAPMNDVLDLCYADLDKAIEEFGKAGNYRRSLTYEPTLNIAYGVYARIAALKNDWQTCRTMAKNARQGYRPATTAEAMSGYQAFNDNEWMWSPSFASIDNMIYGNWCTFFACNSYGAINDRTTNSIDIMLYRQIPETDARRDWWMTADKLPGVKLAQVYDSKAVEASNQQFKIPALVKAARSWFDEHQETYGLGGNPAYSGDGVGTGSSTVIRDGAQVKFWCDGLTGENTRSQVPYMRATEMYLLEAEACAMLGMSSEAQALLKEINQPHNPSYTCTATGQDLIDEVRLYRRIELWGEGFNWFDFKRWNLPIDRKAWVAKDVNSGNYPEALGVVIPVDRNSGWRHGIPYGERLYNSAVPDPIPGEANPL